MSNVVIAFSKAEIASNIKRILAQNGYSVTSVCTTGSAAVAAMQQVGSGIIVCGMRFVDMMYSEIYEYMPEGFQMLLIASAAEKMEKEQQNLVTLSTPLRAHELLSALEMMEYTLHRWKKKKKSKPKERSPEEKAVIDKAKSTLMHRYDFSEDEAHKYIQKRSMDNGTDLIETAQMILSLMGD